MVKSLFKDHFEKHLKLQDWFRDRLSAKPTVPPPKSVSRTSTPPRQSAVHPAYAAEMSIEGINESSQAHPPERGSRPIPPPPPPRPPQPDSSSPEKQAWRWSLVWLAAMAVLGGMGTAALIWLVSLPPQVDCRNPSHLTLDMERLYCAREAAQTGDLAKLIAGIELLKQWKSEHPLHNEATRLIEEWSGQVLTLARHKLKQGDLKGAESAISHIPNTTPVYADAQKAIARWRKYAKSASNIYTKAQTALKQKDWGTVSQQIVLLAEFERDYWELEKGADALAQQLGVEKQAWQTLSRAQKIASQGPQQLREAIPIAQQVPAKTYAAVAAKTDLKQWSQKLVTIGTQKWQKGDRRGALAVLNLPSKVVRTPEVADLYTFSNAYKLASSAISEQWVPSIGEILNLMEAIAAMGQIKSDSPFYAQAQAQKKNWQAQLQDLTQIKYASATAGLGQQATLKLAIGQAQQIKADQPRRLQAQSLIAYWQREAERLEDQPTVDQAIQLAKAGTIEDLQAAIVQASKVDLGRALRSKAQTLIAGWRSQIQTLEDRPKLDQAWDLASQGKLGDAIVAASAIQSGRSLYREAQKAISEWRYQQVVNAQIAQDRPILDRANALAESGNLAAAIDTAAQIDSGRALSGQARSAINRWEDQLIPPAPPSPESYQPSDGIYNPSDNVPFSNDAWMNGIPPLTSPSPTDGATSFPSPTLQPSSSPSPVLPDQITPAPTTTYDPFPQPPVEQSPDSSEPPASVAPFSYEPLTPDPLPPGSSDPLPPNP